MFDKFQLIRSLDSVIELYDTKVAKDTIETLLEIHRNILHNEEIVQFRKIKVQNSRFYQKIWNIMPARQFMVACGWLEVELEDYNMVIFNNDENLHDIMSILLEYRNLAPHESEWQSCSKLENVTDPKFRENELRKKAALERQKELEEYAKEKKYREELSKSVKAQIAADKIERIRKNRTNTNVTSQAATNVNIRSRNHQAFAVNSVPFNSIGRRLQD